MQSSSFSWSLIPSSISTSPLSPTNYSHGQLKRSLAPSLFFSSLALLLLILHRKWRGCRKRRRLPPGSMGWPYIDETLKLYTENPNSFFANRRSRYGEIFKSHLLGCPCVMISSPEAARLVLVKRAHMFKPTYPPSKEKMIGPRALFFHQGHYHSKLKKLVQASFLPSATRGSVSDIERIVLRILPTWEDRSTINTLQEMKRVIQETLKNASIVSFTFREAVEDVELDGYLIPKGWKVLPLFRSIHHSADFFSQPQKFDPSRWQVVGDDDGIQYGPFPVPKQGLPVKVIRNKAAVDDSERKTAEGKQETY